MRQQIYPATGDDADGCSSRRCQGLLDPRPRHVDERRRERWARDATAARPDELGVATPRATQRDLWADGRTLHAAANDTSVRQDLLRRDVDASNRSSMGPRALRNAARFVIPRPPSRPRSLARTIGVAERARWWSRRESTWSRT